MDISISAKKIFFSLLLINLVLIIIHLIVQYILFHSQTDITTLVFLNHFSMDEEVSVPTWFTEILFFIAALLFFAIAYNKIQTKQPFRFHWLMLGCIFVLFSIDEGAQLHELTSEVIIDIYDTTNGYFEFAWVMGGIVAVILFTAFFFHFWLRLPKNLRILFAVAAIIFVGGALGVEMLSGQYFVANEYMIDYGYRQLNALEEGSENLGLSLLIYTLILYLSTHYKQAPVKLHFIK